MYGTSAKFMHARKEGDGEMLIFAIHLTVITQEHGPNIRQNFDSLFSIFSFVSPFLCSLPRTRSRRLRSSVFRYSQSHSLSYASAQTLIDIRSSLLVSLASAVPSPPSKRQSKHSYSRVRTAIITMHCRVETVLSPRSTHHML